MINFLKHYLLKIQAGAALVCVIFLLQGCGAERTTPFNPVLPSSSCSSTSSSSSSSSSSTSSVCSNSSSSSSSSLTSSSTSSSSSSAPTATIIWKAENPTTTPTNKQRNNIIIRDVTDFNQKTMAYIGTNSLSEDFTAGQVVLIDMGEIDSCALHYEFSSISVNDLTDSSVKVTLNFIEKPLVENCTSTLSRPFFFYYIASRKLISFAETASK